MEVVPFRFEGNRVFVLDQTMLPFSETYIELSSVAELCEAIATLRVRGAPLLGIMGAAGVALAAGHEPSDDALKRAAARIISSRPTAVDLGALTIRALMVVLGSAPGDRRQRAWDFLMQLSRNRITQDLAMGEIGAPLLQGSVLTHCNTGALATGGIGTALGVIRTAFERGTVSAVYATETRPLLQGARLTMWELEKLGIPATLLPDTAAASLIASGRVTAVITGADRVAANGDTANKIGTYGLALAANRHGVPFYIAAPASTIDSACPNGTLIPIEFRTADEVGGFQGARWAPASGSAYNPAFDVTPAELITAIITESAILRKPYKLEEVEAGRRISA
jgi:methylthioribose-1-phosphate isomerase